MMTILIDIIHRFIFRKIDFPFDERNTHNTYRDNERQRVAFHVNAIGFTHAYHPMNKNTGIFESCSTRSLTFIWCFLMEMFSFIFPRSFFVLESVWEGRKKFLTSSHKELLICYDYYFLRLLLLCFRYAAYFIKTHFFNRFLEFINNNLPVCFLLRVKKRIFHISSSVSNGQNNLKWIQSHTQPRF